MKHSNKHLGIVVICLLFVSLTWAFVHNSQSDSSNPATNVHYIDATITLETAGEVQPLRVQIAADPAAWQQGMMHRTEWGNIQGMLFVFDEEMPRSFWMKNTNLPMDIVFFDSEGQVSNIAEGAVPLSEALIPSLLPTKYGLELPAGTVTKMQINDTTRLHTEALKEQFQ